jgi:hypothetical protein
MRFFLRALAEIGFMLGAEAEVEVWDAINDTESKIHISWFA